MNANKPRFATKEECEKAIAEEIRFRGCSPMWIGEHYAAAYGVERSGWYLYSRNNLPWTID